VNPGAAESSPQGLGRHFNLLWSAQAVSTVGDGLVYVALPLLATTITHNALLISGVVVASRLPWLLFGLPGGALADRHGPRKTAVVAQVARGVLLGLFALAMAVGGERLAFVYLVAFGLGTFDTGFAASVQSALPSLVASDDLAKANSRLYVVESAGEFFVGPALGGVLFAAAAALPFILDGVSFVVAAVLLVAAFPLAVANREAVQERGTKLLGEVREGLAWLTGQPMLRLIALTVLAFAGFQGMAYGIMVLFATKVLHLSSGTFGLFVAVTAIGDVFGGAIAGRLDERFGPTKLIIGAGFVIGAAYLLIWATTVPVVAALGFIVESVAVASGMVAMFALRQAAIPAELRGRVGNVFRTLGMGGFTIGALLGGVVANGWGLRAPYLLAALCQIVATVVISLPLASAISAFRRDQERNREDSD
jgi:MFS family permease